MILELTSMIQANLDYEITKMRDDATSPDEALHKMEDGLPLDVGLAAVEEALKRLHTLGMLIQKTASKDKQQWPSDQSHCYEVFVKYKFPKAKQSLVDQIGNSLYVRGTSMFYRQQHNRQLAAKGLLHDSSQMRENVALSSDSEESDAPDKAQTSEDDTESQTDPSKTLFDETRSLEESPGVKRRLISSDSSDAGDSSSNGDSGDFEGSASDESFVYIKGSDVEDGQQDASCPVCCEPVGLSQSSKKAFRDHMDRDFQPYVCISEECREPPRFFAHLNDWETHMQSMHTPDWARRIHTVAWYCEMDTCKESSTRREFADKGDFIQHLSTDHSGKLTKPQISARARRNRTTKPRDLLICPLCDCSPKKAWSHPQRTLKDSWRSILRETSNALHLPRESGSTNHRLSDVPSGETESTTYNETEISLEDSCSPPELEEPVIWPTSLSRVYPSRDMTLELFATALQRPHWEKLYEKYHEMMEGVNSQEPSMRKALAIRAILWVTFAKRPLTGPELQHAIIVKPGYRSLDGIDLPRIDDVIESCCGFLVADADGDTLQLADVWMSGWLKANWPDWLRDTPEGITATICLAYLLFDVFGTGSCTSDDDFEERLRSYPFYSYAAHNWVHHTRSDLRGNPLIWDFLQSDEKVSAAYQALMAEKGCDGYSQVPPSRVTGLHLAVHFGLEPTIRDLLQDTFDPDVTDSQGRTPLSWAAERDKPVIVVTLLEQGADVNNSEHREGFAPISWAAWKGLKDVMEPLLQFGADTDARDSNLYTPLILATWNGHREIVELLVDRGAYVDAADVSGRTPLLLAAKNGYHSIAEHLLEHGANIEARDDDGNSSLCWAVKMGHEAVIKLLVEHGADTQAEDDRGQTPLAWALETGRQDIVTLLLETEVKVELQDKGHGEPRSRGGGLGKRGKDRQAQSSADEDSAQESDEESDGEGQNSKAKSRDKGKAPSTGNQVKKAQAPRSLDFSNWRRLTPRE
ncbi:hypothetical protein TgHK011_002235 [Trichoderma gracile]|nr:hypothetical protein TgHK011_002235 [Trichoderma gracile]